MSILKKCSLLIQYFVFVGLLLQSSLLVGSELPYPFQIHLKGKTHEMQILHSGVTALAKRIEMIRSAKKSIELETFILTPDKAGKVIVTELIARAKAGVKVRLLLDKSITVIQFDEYYAKAIAEYGVEVRYYRRAVDLSSAQFRNHRKLLVIDDKQAVLGGRNIGDEYFDLHETYNYHDRDMWVSGPIVKGLRDSFDAYWNSDVVIEPPTPQIFAVSRLHRSYRRADPRYYVAIERTNKAKEFLSDNAQNRAVIKRVLSVGGTHLASRPIFECHDVLYGTDRPAGKSNLGLMGAKYRDHFKLLGQLLKSEAAKTKSSLDFETPYWILNPSWERVILGLADQKKAVRVYTNSLGATDAVYVSTAFYQKVYEYMDRGIVSVVHPAKYRTGQPYVLSNTPQIRYGVHSKTWLRDNMQVMIGSYNMDNRSDYYNTELAIMCNDSPELAQDLAENMKLRRDQGYRVVGFESAVKEDGSSGEADIYGGADEGNIKLMKAIKLPVNWLETLL